MRISDPAGQVVVHESDTLEPRCDPVRVGDAQKTDGHRAPGY